MLEYRAADSLASRRDTASLYCTGEVHFFESELLPHRVRTRVSKFCT
jgi:hypothetical protein